MLVFFKMLKYAVFLLTFNALQGIATKCNIPVNALTRSMSQVRALQRPMFLFGLSA